MNGMQKRSLELLAEIDALCMQCGARYSIIDIALLCATKGSGIYGSEIDIAMLWPDYLKLETAIIDSSQNNREIESLLTNPDMPGWYFRYVDSSTTFFDMDYASCRKAHGIAINIHIARKAFPKSLMPVLLTKHKLARGTEMCLHSGIEPNISYGEEAYSNPFFILAGRSIKKGVSKNHCRLYSYFEKTASLNESEEMQLILPRFISITLPKHFFSVDRVTLAGFRFFATSHAKSYLSVRYGTKWKTRAIPYRRANYMAFGSLSVSYQSYLCEIDQYVKDDQLWKRRRKWLRALRQSKRIKNKQDQWWHVFYMLEDRYSDWKRFAPHISTIEKLYNDGKHGLLWLFLKPYLLHVEQYARKGLAFVIDDDIWYITLDLYCENGRDDFAIELERLRIRKPLPPIQGVDANRYLKAAISLETRSIAPVFS